MDVGTLGREFAELAQVLDRPGAHHFFTIRAFLTSFSPWKYSRARVWLTFLRAWRIRGVRRLLSSLRLNKFSSVIRVDDLLHLQYRRRPIFVFQGKIWSV